MANILQTINEWSPVIFMAMVGLLLFLCKKRIDVVENELAILECRLSRKMHKFSAVPKKKIPIVSSVGKVLGYIDFEKMEMVGTDEKD